MVIGLIAILSALDAKPVDRHEAVVETEANAPPILFIHSSIFFTQYVAEATQERIHVLEVPLSEGTVSEGFSLEVFKPPVKYVFLS